MRNRPVVWMAVGVLALAVALVLIVGRARRVSQEPPLDIVRESLGQFPTPRGAREVIDAFPVDLDNDGNHEAVAVRQRFSRRQGDAALWSDLNGRFEALPIAVFHPNFYTPALLSEDERSGTLPLQRELLGWEASSQRLVRLTRHGDSFQTTAAGDWRAERFPSARIVDSDGDETLETLQVFLNPNAVAFRLGADGRWQTLDAPVSDPYTVVHRLRHSVSTLTPNPSGGIVTSTPAVFDYQRPRPTITLPDGDGDGAPETLDVEQRIVRFSTGKQTPFPHPFTAGEQWFVAELDGVAPQEIVYACGGAPPRFGFEVSVYRLQNGELRPLLQQKLSGAPYLALAAMDVDGDGRAELIASTSESGNHIRWTVWRYANGALTEQSGEHRARLERLDDARWIVRGKRALAASSTHLRRRGYTIASQGGETHSSFFAEAPPYLQAATVLAGVPEGNAAADPARWKVLALDGRLVWFGDHDSDGNEECIVSHDSGGAIAQWRDGQWRLTPLLTGAPIVAAFPVQRNGQPALIVVYRDGALEALSLRR